MSDNPTTERRVAWHRGYDEGRDSVDQDVAVCAPPEEYDGEAATEFMAGFWTGLKHNARTGTTAHAIIQGGRIVSGGWSCEVCGKPTLTQCLADPFGKSGRRVPRCDEHNPWISGLRHSEA